MEAKIPQSLPLSEKVDWKYEDLFNDYPTTKLCMAFLHESYQMDMHRHEFFEINLIISGEGVHYSGNEHIKVRRGDIFIIPPNTLHGYHNIDSLNVYHVLFQSSFFKKYSLDLSLVSSYRILFRLNNQMPIHLQCVNEESLKKLENTFIQIQEALNLEASFSIQSSAYIKSYIYGLELIVNLCDIYEQNKNNPIIQINNKANAIFRTVDYINSNYSSKIDIDTLCKISAMSRTPFFKAFKEITGYSPNELLTNYRLKMANKLLLETDDSVESIALSTGFFDSAHFIKIYKNHYHYSPLNRRNNKI